MITLEGMCYSPWTEKARWALDHHEIPYAYREHLILMGMPKLRWEMRRPFGDITVPALLLGHGKWIMDSYNIAQWADEKGTESKLFSPDLDDEIIRWNELSEEACDAARGLVLIRLKTDKEAQKAALPAFVPENLKKALVTMSLIGGSYISQSFGSHHRSYDEHRERLRSFAIEVTENLKGEYLLGRFSYADLAVAASLNAIRPVSEKYLRLPQPIRKLWTDNELASEFSGLLAWRDRIYLQHRKGQPKTQAP